VETSTPGPFHGNSDSTDFMRTLHESVASWRALTALLLLLCAALACQSAQPGNTAAVPRDFPAVPATSRPAGSARDLSQDESAGGHTLRKHVGRSDDELRQRLRRERNISAASTWIDRATAESAVGDALQRNREPIDRWLSRSGGHPNFVIDYDSDRPLGRSLRRDADQSTPCAHATIVLKWSGPNDYYVLTSYPECRS
jgi:Bacterial CdiA-CT RNAse A domain